MNVLITICARGGSKGIPRKNIVDVGGNFLITHTIKFAQRIFKNLNTTIGLSTDDIEIKKIAEKFDLFTDYKRPANLSNDNTSKVLTIGHLLNHHELKMNTTFEYILDLDVSSPIRNKSDVEEAFDMFKLDKKAQSLFSVNPSKRNPYYNIVERKKNGYFNLVKKPKGLLKGRQMAPKTYDMNASFYWYRRSFFDSEFETPITNKSLIYEMKHICFDLDYEEDLDYMKYLIKKGKIDFI